MLEIYCHPPFYASSFWRQAECTDCVRNRSQSRRGARLIAIPELFTEARRAPDFLAVASVNNSAAKNVLGMSFNLSHNRENTHRPATNCAARRLTPWDS